MNHVHPSRVLATFFRVLRIGQGERHLTAIFAVVGISIGAAQILEPVLFGRVIDALAKEQHFARYVGFWVGLGAMNATLSIFLSIAADRYAHRQRLKAMQMAFERTISLPFRYHSLHGSGRVMRTIQTGSDQVFHIILSFFRENLIALASVVILIPMAFTIDSRMALALCALALLYTTANWIVIRQTHARQAVVETRHQNLTARLVDVMGNVTIVRSFTRVQQEVELFGQLVRDVLLAQYPVLTWWGILNVITRLSSMLAMVAIVAVGANLVKAGEASQGEVVTFVGFSTLLIARLDQFSAFVNRIVSQMPTARNLFELLDHRGEEDQQGGTFVNVPPPGRVVFENVSFLYPTAVREAGTGSGTTGSILGQGARGQGVWDLTFHVEPGETIALVGPTGAGKSTCLALLQRLYSPDHGRILIDDQDIAGLDVQSLCAQIATVFQEPGLFNRSIYDNILVGRPTATREEVEDAARLAHAHDFISARPGGYEFVVGERGMALSGGERQRVAIARAILKNAPILILDEATSALDNATEKLVQAAMDRLRVGKTTFVIAHRLSTIVSADRIFVMADGRIVEAGAFQALRHGKGLFAQLLSAGELGEASSGEAAMTASVGARVQAGSHPMV